MDEKIRPAFHKRCPVCGTFNDPALLECVSCETDLSGIPPRPVQTEEEKTSGHVDEKADGTLILMDEEGLMKLPLTNKEHIIGREGELGGLISGRRFVSRKHLSLRSDDGSITAEDLGSTNGTWLNQERLVPGIRVQIKEGDKLLLGDDGKTQSPGEMYLCLNVSRTKDQEDGM